MELGKIIKDALSYPFGNISKMIIIILMVILGNMMIILMYNNPWGLRVYEFQKIMVPYGNVFNFISIVMMILVSGYALSIFKSTVHGEGKMPDYSLGNDFITGLKHLSIILIYFSIPILLLFIMEHNLYDLNLYFHNCGKEALMGQTMDSLLSIIASVMEDLSFFIVTIPFIILFFIFALFETSAVYGFVKNDDLKDAFDMISVLHNVMHLGRKLAYAFIILFFMLVVSVFVLMIVNRFYGGLIISLIGYSYLIVFTSRFLGLIYMEAD